MAALKILLTLFAVDLCCTYSAAQQYFPSHTGYTVVEYNGKCYGLSYQEATYDDARFFCESEGRFLATIESGDEQYVLERLITDNLGEGFNEYDPQVLIGVNVDWDGQANWENWTPMDYTNWYSGEPNNQPSVGAISMGYGPRGQWVDVKKDWGAFRFICEGECFLFK